MNDLSSNSHHHATNKNLNRIPDLPSGILSCGEDTFYSVSAMTSQDVVTAAMAILKQRLQRVAISLTDPTTVKSYVSLACANEECEIFCVLFLNSQYQLLSFERLFKGTINQATIYPREIAKRALAHNAESMILVHNHPSQDATPSDQDRWITQRLKSAFEFLEIRIIGHLIVGGDRVYSFAEQGEL